MTLSRSQRETILAKIQKLVAEKYFDPKFDDSVWSRVVEHQEATGEGDSCRPAERSLHDPAPRQVLEASLHIAKLHDLHALNHLRYGTKDHCAVSW